MYCLKSLILTVLMGFIAMAMPIIVAVSIPEAIFEGDSDSGGESDVGNSAVSVANGLAGSVGVGSAALNNNSVGSTAVVCSALSCASAAQSDGNVSTAAAGANIHITGPVITITGPITIYFNKSARQ